MENVVADKDRLYGLINSGIDAKDTLDKCEQVLNELCDIERVVLWITERYAYKGVDICNAIDETVRPLTYTCQHHKTLERMTRLLQRAYKVSQAYYKAQHEIMHPRAAYVAAVGIANTR